MSRPNGPLPAIPSEENQHKENDERNFEEPLGTSQSLLVISPAPPPSAQPNNNNNSSNSNNSEGVGIPMSRRLEDLIKNHSDTSGSIGVGLEGRKSSCIRSLASSLESTVGSSLPIIHSSSDDSQFSMNPEDYKIGPAVGFGSSAIVYHTTYLPLNLTVALKMIDLDHFERNQIDELRREIQVMTLCKHPNLLRILASFVHQSKLWIVTPYLRGGSCLDIMKTGFRDGLEETAIATILLQALQGLEYLHRNGHLHRDVKAGNLLMDADGTVQLADFGVSSSLMEDVDRRGTRKTFVGTPCWMAPEVMEMTRGYDAKADIWSFGITALELAYGHAPFAKYPPMKVIYLTLSSAPPTLDRKRSKNKYSRIFKEMIDTCLQRDPTKRPSAESLLKHPFFKASKKKSFLVTTILSLIPPLEQRPRVTKLIKQISGNANLIPPETAQSAEWNFSDESESETEAFEASTAPNSPGGVTDDVGALDSSHAATLTRCSRFVVEQDPSEDPPSSMVSKKSSPVDLNGFKMLSGEISGVNNDKTEESTIRKGRFSVMESGATNGENPEMSTEGISPIILRNLEGEMEDGRRSRFKVEPSSIEGTIELPPLPPPSSLLSLTLPLSSNQLEREGTPGGIVQDSPSIGGGQSRFHISHPNLTIQEEPNVDNIPPPYPIRGYNQLYDENEMGRGVGGVGGGGLPYHREYAPPQSQPSLIFVHPSQLDQLLLLNELVRQQLVELRNSAIIRASRISGIDGGAYGGGSAGGGGGGGAGGSLSYHPTIHSGEYDNGEGYDRWNNNNHHHYHNQHQHQHQHHNQHCNQHHRYHSRGQMVVEDPQVAYPPHFSTYSPTPLNCDNGGGFGPWGFNPELSDRSLDTKGFFKRRSASIDNRTIQNDQRPLLPIGGLGLGGRVGGGGGGSSRPTSSLVVPPLPPLPHLTTNSHRSTQSLKSPITTLLPLIPSDHLQDGGGRTSTELLQREIEILRIENEKLRKRS